MAQAADSKAVSRKPSQVEPKIGLETQVAGGQTAEDVEANTAKKVGTFLNDATKVIGVMKKLRSEAEAVNLL